MQVTPAPAASAAGDRAAPIQTALVAPELAPATPRLDAGYGEAARLVNRRAAHAVTGLGPVRPEAAWQAASAGA